MPAMIAVYPGSFDPVTRGHIDIIERALRLFDRVIVAVSNNYAKKHLFTVQERVGMIRESVSGLDRAEVGSFSGLLVDYLKSKKARVVIRGLRVISDMDYEFQMAAMNRRLYRDVETVFLMPDEQHTYLSSSMVKEVARMGIAVKPFVTAPVEKALRSKFRAAAR